MHCVSLSCQSVLTDSANKWMVARSYLRWNFDPHSAATNPGNQPIIYGNQLRKPTYSMRVRLAESQITVSNPESINWIIPPGIVYHKIPKTWLLTDSSLIFAPIVNLKPTRESQICMLHSSHRIGCPTFYLSAFSTPRLTAWNQGTHEASLFFHFKAHPTLCHLWSLCQNTSDGGWHPHYSKLWIILAFLIWLVFAYFHTSF